VSQYSVHIRQNLVVPEADDHKPGILQNPRPLQITITSFRVLTAVNFDDQLQILTKKVRDKPRDRDLPAKLQSVETAASELQPKLQFGIRLPASKLSRGRNGRHR
jgi:hypothetical protein